MSHFDEIKMSLTLVSSSLHKIQNIKNKKNTSLLLLGQAHTKLNKEKHPKPLIPSYPYHIIFIFSLMKTSRTHWVREQPKKAKADRKRKWQLWPPTNSDPPTIFPSPTHTLTLLTLRQTGISHSRKPADT